jgi:cytochrome P450
MTDPQTEVLYNPLDPSAHADPYPQYRRLRELDPVHRSPYGFYVLTRYSDIMFLTRSHDVSSEFHTDASWAKRRGGPDSTIVNSTRSWMLMIDGMAHRRIRGVVNHVFTGRAIERLRGRVDSLIKELLADLEPGVTIDLINELALPLPVIVICELLGLPAEDRDQCRRWTEAIGHVVDPVITGDMSGAMNDAAAEFRAYIGAQLAQRRAKPGEDVLSLLATTRLQDGALTDREIIDNVLLLFAAGHETTVNLIGNGTLALLQNPDQVAKALSAGGITDSGVDELVRYDAPVQLVARLATADILLQDTVIEEGSKMMLLLGAANRDPERYADPDTLRLDRADVKPASFGGGAHYCIGALLGKMEAGLAFNHLFSNHRLELATDELQWRPNVNFRGLRSLPLTVSAR